MLTTKDSILGGVYSFFFIGCRVFVDASISQRAAVVALYDVRISASEGAASIFCSRSEMLPAFAPLASRMAIAAAESKLSESVQLALQNAVNCLIHKVIPPPINFQKFSGKGCSRCAHKVPCPPLAKLRRGQRKAVCSPRARPRRK